MRVPYEPTLWFHYHYVLQLGFLEGRRGLIAALIRSDYIAAVRAKVFEMKLRLGNPEQVPPHVVREDRQR